MRDVILANKRSTDLEERRSELEKTAKIELRSGKIARNNEPKMNGFKYTGKVDCYR